MRTTLITRNYLALLCVLLYGWSSASFASCQDVPDNLIPNCSFELQGDDTTKALDWFTSGNGNGRGIRINSAADAADGQHYMELAIPHELDPATTDIFSTIVAAPAHARIELTAKVKATDILMCGQETLTTDDTTCLNHHVGRVTVQFLDSNKKGLVGVDGKQVSTNVDASKIVGDFCANYDSDVCDWRQIHFSQTLPENTAYVRVDASVFKTKGTMLIDDIVLRIKQDVPLVDATAVRKPVLMPAPKSIQYLNRTLPMTSVAIIGTQVAPIAFNNLKEYLESKGFSPAIEPSEAELPNYDLVIDFGNPSNDAHKSRLTQRYPSRSFEELGSQGYFLSITEGDAYNRLQISANTEQGHFYGVQTFKQLIEEESAESYFVHAVDIFDYPVVSKRGIWMGVDWFTNRTIAIQRLTELKLNGIWNIGSYLNNILNEKWRITHSDTVVFPPTLEAAALGYIADTNNNNITPHFVIRPYVSEIITPDNFLTMQPINYSEPELDADTGLPLRTDDIDVVVRKLEWLLDNEVTNIGLDFNDFSNKRLDLLYYDDDISNYSDPSDPFGDIARAHLSFTNRVYNEIKNDSYTDFNFRVIPMRYVRFGNANERTNRYLQIIRELPAEIALHTAQYSQSDIDVLVAETAPLSGARRVQQLTNNFYAQGYNPEKQIYITPFTPHMAWDAERLDGTDFLPNTPGKEGDNTALIAWRTFADYTWNATDYDPVESFQRAAAIYTGVTGTFTYPAITALSSNNVFTTEHLEITGTGFNTTAGTTSVIFANGASVAADVIDDTTIRFTIPAEAIAESELTNTGPVTVIQDGLSVTYAGELTIHDAKNDTDEDGDPDISDCADLDSAINHDAIEIIRDNIDQDCNGYDLTTDIISATYSRGFLTVIATNLPPGVNLLTLVGFDDMKWKSGHWQYRKKTSSSPATVTVSSVEGVTLPFIVDQ